MPDRVPFFDHGGLMPPYFAERIKKNECANEEEYNFRRQIECAFNLGADFVHGNAGNFTFKEAEAAPGAGEDAFGGKRDRKYRGTTSSLMGNENDYERYPWPAIAAVDFDRITRHGALLRPGMKIIVSQRSVFEHVIGMMGYENLCYCIVENPVFFKKVCDRVGELVIEWVSICAGMDDVGAILMYEDMGFKTQTMISPEMLREYIFPWHARFAKAIHACGKPVILHACGNLRTVNEDIIASGFDAKQSFEDIIEPVWEFKKHYNGRISAMGGFDMDKLTRMNETEVRAHTRFLIDSCAAGGGYAMGSGNSVANYIPVENYLAMLEETCLYGRY
ncbi:MAG: uroporphyrinogen decarboxylase family protein [Spirochaetota bacterium]